MLELATAALPVLLDVFRELFESVKPLLKQLPDLIKFIAKIIKACAKADVIEALAKGFIAYKVAVVAVTAVMKVYNTIQAILYVKSVLAAKGITLMQAAFKLLKLALVSHPIFAIAAVIGAVGTAIALFSKKADKGNEANAQLKQHIDEVTGSIHSMRDAFDNAKVTLPDINKTISANGYFMSDIDTQIADKEKQITDALTTAMRDQKGVRDEDLENIRGYMQELQMLEDDKLSIYREQQMSQFDTLDLKLKSGNLDQQGIADLLISTDEAYDQSVIAIKEEFEGRQATINSLYAVERKSIVENENLTGQAKSEALKQWQARKDNELLESMRQENELLAESAKSRDYTYNQALEQSNKLVEKADFNFDILKQKSDSYKKDLDIMDKTIADTSASGIQKYNEASANADLMVKDITNMFLNLDNQSAQSLNNYFMTLNEAKNKGVTVSDDLKQQADTILTPFENLPPELQETGKQILAGLLQGMTDENGNVIDTTNMTCQELVEAAREAFDVHSPSRVFAEIGMNIGLGLLQGISLIMPVVTAAVTTNMMGLVTSASGFNLDSMGESAENISETVILAFSNMNKVSCQHMSGMQKSVVLISKLMSTTVIVNLKTMSVQAVIIVQSMSVSIVSTMSQMKSSIDGLDLYSTGVNVMNGLINGMESRRGGLISTAQSIAQTVKNTMNNALDIHSPSRELYKTGVYTGLGQINGMKSTLPEIQQTADKMGQTAIPDDNNRYTPSASPATYSRSTTSENHTYSPTFNLTISGTNDDRTMARKVKKWISEALEETFSSYESKNATVREV